MSTCWLSLSFSTCKLGQGRSPLTGPKDTVIGKGLCTGIARMPLKWFPVPSLEEAGFFCVLE